MPRENRAISFTPSQLDTYMDCPARFWFELHRDPALDLWPDGTMAQIGQAIHRAAARLEAGTPISQPEMNKLARTALRKELAKTKTAIRSAEQRQRLALSENGLGILGAMLRSEATVWVTDARKQERLLWWEKFLDNGPPKSYVDIAPGITMRTRADMIGVQRQEDGSARVVIRDMKGRSRAVVPQRDNGLIIRAIWATNELAEARCAWFLAGRRVEVDRDRVVIEVVNVLAAGTARFHIRHVLDREQASQWADRIAMVAMEMDELAGHDRPDNDMASPGGLCHRYCRFLSRCGSGQAYVTEQAGANALRDRLGTAG